MDIIDIGYEKKLSYGKLILHKSCDTDCEEYELFLPIMRNFIQSKKWVFARSMPQCPHEYVCKSDLRVQEDIDLFVNVVKFIQKYGYDKMWYKNKTRYINVGMFKYWTMGWHWTETIIINRALEEKG